MGTTEIHEQEESSTGAYYEPGLVGPAGRELLTTYHSGTGQRRQQQQRWAKSTGGGYIYKD